MSVASPVPLVDLAAARDGSAAGRHAVAAAVDTALHEVGFLLVTGHGVDPELLTAARSAALEFFHLPAERKATVAIRPDSYRGWVPSGAETNAAAYGLPGGPPDAKESFVFGPPAPADAAYAAAGARWFLPNRLPAEVPALGETFGRLFTALDRVALELMALCEVAVGVPAGTFVDHFARQITTLDANWYPPGAGRPAEPGQFRVGPHTDYGGLTLLDREPGLGGLQVQLLDDRWVDAPYIPGALTVNTGDLISHWSGGRWRSTRHRVLPPPADAPEEELLSLVFFHDPDYDTLVTPLGQPDAQAITAGDYLARKLAALTGAAA